MKYNPQNHNRRSIRLPEYDYSQSGYYFITICTYQKQYLFGEIKDDRMILNQIGNIVVQEWLKSSEIRKEIQLDQWVLMPNHIHSIVVINKDLNVNKVISVDQGANPSWSAFPCVLRRRGV